MCKLPGILGHLDVRLNVLGRVAVSNVNLYDSDISDGVS